MYTKIEKADSFRMNSLNGHPIAFHDVEGIPPLPKAVDDDNLFSDRIGEQSSNHVSYMIGFNAIARIFQLIYHCTWRHRSYTADEARESSLAWIAETHDKLTGILDGLPRVLQPDANHQATVSFSLFYGMQAANICITALCLELALVSLGLSA